jgi:hypothetical protein
MSEDMKDDDFGPPLFVPGRGITLEEAVESANAAAGSALPIPDQQEENVREDER